MRIEERLAEAEAIIENLYGPDCAKVVKDWPLAEALMKLDGVGAKTALEMMLKLIRLNLESEGRWDDH